VAKSKKFRYIKMVKTPEGRWHVRVQIRSAKIDRQRTLDTQDAAIAWGRSIVAQYRRTGYEGTLGIAEANEYREAKALVRGADLRDIARYWLHRHPINDITVGAALDIYQAKSVARMSRTTRSAIKSKLSWIRRSVGTLGLHEVELSHLEKASAQMMVVARDTQDSGKRSGKRTDKEVAKASPTTINNYIRVTRRFFRWCCLTRLGGLQVSPVSGWAPEPENRGAVEYLPVADAEAFLRASEEYDPSLVPLFSLSLFGGIRPGIAARLAPMAASYIDLEDRYLKIPEFVRGQRINKTRTYTIDAEVPGPLWEWLRAYWDGGPMDVRNYNDRRKVLVKKAGISWPHNAMRHTFGTYCFALTKDPGVTAAWLGHPDPNVTMLYYVSAEAKRPDAEAFFALKPKPGAKPVPHRKADPHAPQVNWPSNDVLLEWKRSKTNQQIASALGCSETLVRKRIKKIRPKPEE